MTTESPPRPKPKTDALRLARKMLAAGGIEIENAHDRWLAEVALTTYLTNDIPGSALKAALQ